VAWLNYDKVVNGVNAISTVVIAIATVVGGFLVYWQLDDARTARHEDSVAAAQDRKEAQQQFTATLGEMKRWNDLTRDSFNDAHQLAVATRRARIIFTECKFRNNTFGAGQNVQAITRLRNSGVNPGTTRDMFARLFIRHEKMYKFVPERTRAAVGPGPITNVIPGGESYEIPTDWFYVSAGDYHEVQTGDAVLYAFVYIVYSDEFGEWGTDQLWFFNPRFGIFLSAPFGSVMK
jgi:hypothetical protein